MSVGNSEIQLLHHVKTSAHMKIIRREVHSKRAKPTPKGRRLVPVDSFGDIIFALFPIIIIV